MKEITKANHFSINLNIPKARVLIAVGFLLGATVGLAQSGAQMQAGANSFSGINLTATAVRAGVLALNATNIPAISLLSDDQLTALVNTLDATPTIPADALPMNGLVGAFWSLQNPDMPPLPGNTSGSAVWQLSDGNFLLSDLNYNYSAETVVSLATSPNLRMNAMSYGDPPSPGGGGSGTNTPDASTNTPPNYGTNLWIARPVVTSGYLTGIGTNTLADVQYEIQSRTNLAQTDWQSEGFIFGSEPTNWTPLSVARNNRTNLFIRLKSWAGSDGSGLPDWWQLQYFGTTGVDPYGNPAGDGWNNLQKFQNGMNPNVFYTPAAPQGFNVSYNSSNSTATLKWLPPAGNVTSYTVERTYQYFPTYGYTPQISDTNPSASAVSLVDNVSAFLADPKTGGNINVNYKVRANYSGGGSAWSGNVPLEAPSFAGNISSGAQGPVLTVATMPANTMAIRLTELNLPAMNANDYAHIYVTNFVVGVSNSGNLAISLPNIVTFTNVAGLFWEGQAIGANGSLTANADVGGDFHLFSSYSTNWIVPPIYQGAIQLKQNLIFQLRAAGVAAPFEYVNPNRKNIEGPSSYTYSGFYDFDDQTYGYIQSLNPYRPFLDNYFDRNFIFTPSDVDAGGNLITGAVSDLNNEVFVVDPLAYQCPITASNFPALLSTNTSRWMLYDASGFYPDNNIYEIGLITNVSETVVYMAANMVNWFGLRYISANLAYSDETGTTLLTNVLLAGTTVTLPAYVLPFNGNMINAYPETAQPRFQTKEYDFWPLSYAYPSGDPYAAKAYGLPGNPNFTPTNAGVSFFITSPGTILQVVGYAKLAVTNSAFTGVYAYLGQYFDKAYKTTNGVATTSATGVLSPYGNFLATEPGPTALMTMPDVDTGARGTCTVYSVSLQLDANHDGNMDLAFNGADATSLNSPFVFWCNNNCDRIADGGQYYDDCQYISGMARDFDFRETIWPQKRLIPNARDLEDFARLWVCGVTTNLLNALPSGSTVTLNWGDVGSPNSGNPTIDLFQAADVDGGMGYLTNAAIASQQTNNTLCQYLGRLGPGQSIQLNASTFSHSWAGNHFIWCGVTNGTGGLNLTVADANSNVLAQTTAFIQIVDIKQMYERWTVGDTVARLPMNTPILATDNDALPVAYGGLPPIRFQYPAPQTTNTSYILFVHGWNEAPWLKDRRAEAAFKRLYCLGYQGRFGEFRYPVTSGFNWLSVFIGRQDYDESEQSAWKSGVGLLNLLKQLNTNYPSHVYLFAHSLGNVVAGEALRLSGTNQVVNTYVASQAALSAHMYDATVTNTLFSTIVTPNFPTNWFASVNGGGAGRVINFYNPNDYALGANLWEVDQSEKPRTLNSGWSYHFYGTPYDNTPHYTPGGVDDNSPWRSFGKVYLPSLRLIDITASLTNRYEVMAFASQSRSTALGMTAVALPRVQRNVDLTSQANAIWPTDPFNNNYGDLFWHSAEFENDNAQQQGYWRTLLHSAQNGFGL